MRLFLLLFVHFLCINLWASTGQDMVKAAQQLLESLTPEQRTKMTFEVKDTSREIWHYLPVASFARFGVPLNQLDADQDALVYHLLEVSLSTEGYDKARQIMDLEKILKVMENNSPNRDPEQYHIAIYGTPSLKDIWSWSFSGHHISLHFTMIDGQIADTPTFLGSNPAEVRQGAHQGLRVLKDEEDMGLKLIQSMSEAQQKEAIFTEEAPYEIFTAAQSKVDPLNPEGIVFVDLTD
ncbi:MAG: DUF3500 domain-containing protein, partial [Saprospiraceae bacterium]|nr:DUF3500 domain-containing protein [Saprospiraceae bacterium]